MKQYLIDFLPYLGIGFLGSLTFYFLKNYFKIISGEIGKMFTDTLKIRDAYSRTSITMFASFLLATIYSIYDLIKAGFKFEVFVTYMAVATGIKITDALSKKMTGQVYNGEKEAIKLNEDCPPDESNSEDKKSE